MSTINAAFKFANSVTTATRNNAGFQASSFANNRNTLMRNIMRIPGAPGISLNTRLGIWGDAIGGGTSRNFVVDRSGNYVMNRSGLPVITRGG